MERIKKNDTVEIITGKYCGKQGLVVDVLPKARVLVKGVNVVTRHVKARKQGEVSGIKKEERSVRAANVMPVCSSCKTPCRVGAKVIDTGKKVRICNRCKEIF